MIKTSCPIMVLAAVFDRDAQPEDILCRGALCELWVERTRESRCAITLLARAVEYIAKEGKAVASRKDSKR